MICRTLEEVRAAALDRSDPPLDQDHADLIAATLAATPSGRDAA